MGGCGLTNIPSGIIERLQNDQVVVFPTSTQPGLACMPTSTGLDRMFELKSRTDDKPVSIGVASLQAASSLVHIPEYAEEFLADFPAGSITLLLQAIQVLDLRLGGELVAIRVLSHPLANLLAQKVGAITATSANPAGQKVETDVFNAAASLGLGPDCVLAGHCPGGLPSTLVRFIEADDNSAALSAIVMREGIVPPQDVKAWQPKAR